MSYREELHDRDTRRTASNASTCHAVGTPMLRLPPLNRLRGIPMASGGSFWSSMRAMGGRAAACALIGALSLALTACNGGQKPDDPSRPVPRVERLPPVSSLPTAARSSAMASAVPAGSPQNPVGMGDRYGVIVQSPESPSAAAYAEGLGVGWFLNEGHSAVANTGPARKLPIIKEIRPGTYLSREQMAGLLRDHPGVDLVLANEPNVGAQGDSSGEEYAEAFHYYNGLLKGEMGLDPSRRLVAGNTLNWDLTCLRRSEKVPESHGCTWDYSGREFVNEFRAVYKVKFGTEPPVEVWGVHAYPINWKTFPTTDSGIAIEQIEEMRRYLDALPAHAGTPIWVTEFGLHWGFSCGRPCLVEKNGMLAPGPGAEYREAEVLDYVADILDWLESWAVSYRIEKWFLYATYIALGEADLTGNQGLTLYQRPDPSLGLSPAGELYKRRALAH
ncbi:MAG: hypothetical protein EXR57_05230 [Dehalococcoidia bacterium]|nr:hypothetical protein [Dehalococcoidia bacterium]MSQ35200.1 hypothetical protein [Dehalococcoidia bacterium]